MSPKTLLGELKEQVTMSPWKNSLDGSEQTLQGGAACLCPASHTRVPSSGLMLAAGIQVPGSQTEEITAVAGATTLTS